MRTVVVFGAAGHVGSAVSKKLPSEGYSVSAPSKTSYDVAIRTILNYSYRQLDIHAVVYCVGHCPWGGFLNAIKHPLSQYPAVEFAREVGMHIQGPFNIFRGFLPVIHPGGHFVFMSSAATRILQMPRPKRPPIHLYHHLAVIAAEDALIEGMRMDPATKKRGIKIHRIVPPAIGDSAFHQVDDGPKPPVTVTTAEVVDAIIGTLSAQDHQDVLML